MTVSVINAQRESPVNTTRMARLARQAVRRLGIRTPGTLAVTFIGSCQMRALNKRFGRHDAVTDVLSFRYDGEPVVGEILVAPRVARAYARHHGLAYEEELGRYVVHGLLHWLGEEDTTTAQRRRMQRAEDRLLAP
jgi:probable rRNA maturation factor